MLAGKAYRGLAAQTGPCLSHTGLPGAAEPRAPVLPGTLLSPLHPRTRLRARFPVTAAVEGGVRASHERDPHSWACTWDYQSVFTF